MSHRIVLASDRSLIGGAQRSLATLADGLRDRGKAVTVALQEPGPLAAVLGRAGHDVHIAPTEPVRGRALVSVGFAAHAWAADAVEVDGPRCLWQELTIRGRPAEGAAFAAGADLAASPTPAAAAALRSRLPDVRVEVIPPGVAVGDIDAHLAEAPTIRRSIGLGPRDALAVVVARLDPAKGQAIAIEAVQHLRSAGRPVHLALVGAGVDSHLPGGPIPGVHRVGHVDDPGPWFAAADVALAPSTHEAFGLSIVEALAHGTPVIATATDGARFILDDGRHGMLLPYATAEALAGAIGDHLDDPRSSSPERAEAFSPTACANRWDHLLSDLLCGYGHAD